MEYKIVKAYSIMELNSIVNEYIKENWEPKGSHQVAIINMTNRFSGSQIHGSSYEYEFSQTMVRYSKPIINEPPFDEIIGKF